MNAITETSYDRLCGLLVYEPTENAGKLRQDLIKGLELDPMPCGHEPHLTGQDQQCPNSGKCGYLECWIEKYERSH